MSGKVTHAIVGTDAGAKKLEQLRARPNVVQLDEDGLFDLIRKSFVEPKKEDEGVDVVLQGGAGENRGEGAGGAIPGGALPGGASLLDEIKHARSKRLSEKDAKQPGDKAGGVFGEDGGVGVKERVGEGEEGGGLDQVMRDDGDAGGDVDGEVDDTQLWVEKYRPKVSF